MWRKMLTLLALAPCLVPAVIIDRIAIVVGDSIVKDSDINRDIRVTSFLNGDPLDLSDKARKANRQPPDRPDIHTEGHRTWRLPSGYAAASRPRA